MADIKMFFDGEDELRACTREWKERLGLSDWCIRVRFALTNEFGDASAAGECTTDWVGKSAIIQILRRECMPEGAIQRQPHEQVLIHELLHCKFMGIGEESPTVEAASWETNQHALLEDMAKALYCAKYGLPLAFFTEALE